MSDSSAFAAIRALADQIIDIVVDADLWSRGDGHGGTVLQEILDAAAARGLSDGPARPTYVKERIPAGLRLRVFQRDGYHCLACGQADITALTADHIRPESEGGPTTFDNLQTLCGPCNSAKGTTTIDYRRSAD